MQYQQPSYDAAPVPESSVEPTYESGAGRVAMVSGVMEEEAGKRYPDVSRMSKEERDAHFAEKRRERELEAIKKLGLNPEDFPSARSAVRNFTPITGGRRGDRQPRPSHGSQANGSWGSEQRQAAPVQAQSSYNQPQASAGYGDERVSGWGSSSSDEAVNQPITSSACFGSSAAPSQAQSASGWSLDEPAPAVPRPVPTYEAPKPTYETPKPAYEAPKPAYEAPKAAHEAPRPAAPSRNLPSNPNDLSVSGWDIPEPMPLAPPASVAPALVPAPSFSALGAAPSAGDNWKIDTAPVGQIPERRPLYSYEAEPFKPVEAISKPAEPTRPVAKPAKTKTPVNPLESVDSWGCAEPTPMAAPVKPAPMSAAVPVAQPVAMPAPMMSTPAPVARPMPVAPSKPAGNPLDYVDSWGCDELVPMAAPRVPESAPVQATRVTKPIQTARVPEPVQAPRAPEPAPIVASPIVQPPSFAPSVPRAAPRGNLLEAVDSWGCDDSFPTAPPSAPFVPAPIRTAPIQATPVQAPPFVPAPVQAAPIQAAPLAAPSVPFVPAPIQAAPVHVAAPFVPAPRQEPPRMASKPAGNPLDYVDSWDCDDPIPTAPAPVPVAAMAPAVAAAAPPTPAVAAMAPGSVKCPNCQHCFRP